MRPDLHKLCITSAVTPASNTPAKQEAATELLNGQTNQQAGRPISGSTFHFSKSHPVGTPRA